MTAPVTREEGRAWVRVALVRTAAQEQAERKRVARLAYEARTLPNQLMRARDRLRRLENRAAELRIG